MKKLLLMTAVCFMAFGFACNSEPDNTPSNKHFNITSKDLFIVGAEGGNVAITYTISDPVAGATVEVNCSEAWLSFDSSMEGVIIASVSANATFETRTATVELTYDSEVANVTIMQSESAGNNQQPGNGDVLFAAEHLNGYYYGQLYAEEFGEVADRYVVMLSDKGVNNAGQAFPDATYYYIDTFAPVATNEAPYRIAVGTYTFDAQNSGRPFTFTAKNSRLMHTTQDDVVETFFTAGEMFVTETSITLNVTVNGKAHTVTYSGDMTLQDVSNNNNDDDDPTTGQENEAKSTYTSDYEITFPGEHRAKWMYEGDYWRVGYSNYTIMIMNKSNGTVFGDTLQLDIITDDTNTDGDFYGKYECSYKAGKNIMMAGFGQGITPVGSWLIEYGSGGMSNYAMLIKGNVEIIDNGNGTSTIILDAYDCKNNHITCNWTGIIEDGN